MTDFDTLLDQCLARLQGGESVARILQDHPDQAARLRPLLEVAAHVYVLPAPRARPTAYTAARQRMLAALETKKTAPPASFGRPIWPYPVPDFSFLRRLPTQVFKVALLALLIASLAWLFSSLDLDPDPVGEQTPTATPTPSHTPTELPPTFTNTPILIPTATQTLLVAPFPTPPGTPTPSPTPRPVFITRTPTPTATRQEEDNDPTLPPAPSETPTETPLPPYPPPVTSHPCRDRNPRPHCHGNRNGPDAHPYGHTRAGSRPNLHACPVVYFFTW